MIVCKITRMLQTVFILYIFLQNLMQTVVHETSIHNYVFNFTQYKIQYPICIRPKHMFPLVLFTN